MSKINSFSLAAIFSILPGSCSNGAGAGITGAGDIVGVDNKTSPFSSTSGSGMTGTGAGEKTAREKTAGVKTAGAGQKIFAAASNATSVAPVDTTRRSFRSGVHEWTPVKFSEEHALAAITGGPLIIKIPGVAPILLDYQRHVEHADGNWTFVGRDTGGGDAVITFGSSSVFGSVETSSGTVRLTTNSEGGWIVKSPRGQGEAPLRGGGLDDALPTPKSKGRLVLDGTTKANHPTTVAGGDKSYKGQSYKLTTQNMTAENTTVVDVVVGYTGGFVTSLGGDGAARTRIINLAEITNQAYVNSQLDVRLRLVHAIPVSFPDATNNSDALSKLSGYTSGVGQTPGDPAFNSLRAARDQYGGDVVFLMRDFQTIEVSAQQGELETTFAAGSQRVGFFAN